MRWKEEVLLLHEEMRRVAAFLEWQASWWVERGGAYTGVDATHTEGLRAYGYRQASVRQGIHAHFVAKWQWVSKYMATGKGGTDLEVVENEIIDSDDEDA
jgi:hypothetical protein